MKKKKLFNNGIYCCLTLILTSTLAGCLSSGPPPKAQKVIRIQKKRIKGLQKELARKNRQLEKLKAERWTGQRRGPAAEIGEVKSLFNKGQLVLALRKSSQLKKKYPRSKELRKIRIMIFQKMGLKRQAQKEALEMRKAISKKNSRNRRRL